MGHLLTNDSLLGFAVDDTWFARTRLSAKAIHSRLDVRQPLRLAAAALLNLPTRSSGFGIAGIGCAGRFDQQDVRFFLGDRAVLDTFGDDEQFSGTQGYVTAPHLDRDPAFQHQEQIVRVVMLVPGELSFRFHDKQVVSVELADGPGLPVSCERSELFSEVDCFHE
jgi:hypothetical protein